MRATSVSSTRAALLNRRLRLAFLADNKWRRAECARSTFPRAVILKRFATDLRVLLRAIGFGMREKIALVPALTTVLLSGVNIAVILPAKGYRCETIFSHRFSSGNILAHGEYADRKAPCGDSRSRIWWA